MEKITVLIPCRNEESNIRECLESVKWADEILVVDSGSTDKTLDIVMEYTNSVLQHEYVNSAAQKNWGIPQAKHEWVLIVDADERVTPELQDEIKSLLESGPDTDAYKIRRQNHFLGRQIKFCGWQNDKVTRLFKKSKGRYPEKWVHADMEIDGTVSHLKNTLLHFTCTDFQTYIHKWERYTTWAANDIAARRKRIGYLQLWGHPAWRFFKQYILKGGFLDGKEGFIICKLAATSVFLKYAKARALIKKQMLEHLSFDK